MEQIANRVLRLEFVGAMGAGKTTLFNATWQTRGWSSVYQEKRRIAWNQCKCAPRLIRKTKLGIAILLPFLPESAFDRLLLGVAYGLLDESPERYGPIARVAFSSPVSVGLRPSEYVRKQAMFIRDLLDVALIQRYSRGRCVLHAESLLQRGLALGLASQNMSRFAGEFVSSLPGPTHSVFLRGSEAQLRERLITRDGSASRHLRSLSHAIYMAEALIVELTARGHSVLVLDSAAPTSVNVRLVLDWWAAQSLDVSHRV